MPGTSSVARTETGASRPLRSSLLLRQLRLLRLGLHLAAGALTIALLYPCVSPDRRQGLRQRWSRRLLEVLGVRLQVEGDDIVPGALLVANHVSWVDIFAINALAPAAFVSKAEVRNWPLIGWLAARNGTIFLRRGSRGHAKIINAETAALLDAGHNVAIFPEGTTSDGRQVLAFHAALLQPAIACAHPVQPLALSYHDAGGGHSRAAAYDGDLSLGESIANIIAARGLGIRVQVTPALATGEDTDRRELARNARAAIVARLQSAQGASAVSSTAEPSLHCPSLSLEPESLRHLPAAPQ
jgi:1-acyl-sn-glycerol-3-phosphate acyltransferase